MWATCFFLASCMFLREVLSFTFLFYYLVHKLSSQNCLSCNNWFPKSIPDTSNRHLVATILLAHTIPTTQSVTYYSCTHRFWQKLSTALWITNSQVNYKQSCGNRKQGCGNRLNWPSASKGQVICYHIIVPMDNPLYVLCCHWHSTEWCHYHTAIYKHVERSDMKQDLALLQVVPE